MYDASYSGAGQTVTYQDVDLPRRGLHKYFDFSLTSTWPALMALWSMTLLLTASCLSPLSGFESHHGHVRKLQVTWGSAVFFRHVRGFPPPVTTAYMAENVTKNEIPN